MVDERLCCCCTIPFCNNYGTRSFRSSHHTIRHGLQNIKGLRGHISFVFHQVSPGTLLIENACTGLDLAYIRNGYVYHTKYDDLQHLSLGSIQRAGDNLKSLVTYLVNMDWPSEKDPSDNVVFFDYLGIFMVMLSNFAWHFFNCLLIGLAFYQSIAWVTSTDSGTLFSNHLEIWREKKYHKLFVLLLQALMTVVCASKWFLQLCPCWSK